LVAKPSNTPIYAEIKVQGTVKWKGTINPQSNQTPTFAGIMGGPVEVEAWTNQYKTTPAYVFASQRVLWNGYFNEIVGKGM
jgi:hypothetical protein